MKPNNLNMTPMVKNDLAKMCKGKMIIAME